MTLAPAWEGARSLGDPSPGDNPAVAPAAPYLLLRFEDVAPEGVVSAVSCDVTKYFQVLRVMRHVEDSRWERDKGNQTPGGVSAPPDNLGGSCVPGTGWLTVPGVGGTRWCRRTDTPAIVKAGGNRFKEYSKGLTENLLVSEVGKSFLKMLWES